MDVHLRMRGSSTFTDADVYSASCMTWQCCLQQVLEGEESAKVIDREYLKHRAHKLTMKNRHDAARGTMPAQVAAH